MNMSGVPKGAALTITLKHSVIGTPMRHRAIVRGLGLRKTHQRVTRLDTPQVRGLIHKVRYLLDVTSI
jgi:large subunit ribosomal protein L30